MKIYYIRQEMRKRLKGKYIKTSIKSIGILDGDIYYIHLNMPKGYTWQAGQHSRIKLDVQGKVITKPFSFMTVMSEGYIAFITRLSKGSQFKSILLNKKIGDHIEIGMAFGDLTLEGINNPVMLISNGVAIGAVRSLLKSYIDSNSNIPEIIQLQVDRGIDLFKDDFRLWSNVKTIKYNFSSNRDEFKWMLDFQLQRLLLDHDDDPIIYLLGSNIFVQDTKTYLKDMGIEASAIISDGPVYMTLCGCDPENGCGCGANLIMIR